VSQFMNENKIKQLVEISESCNKSILNELITHFDSETLKLISEIKTAVKNKNFQQIHKSASILKLEADYIGATRLSELSASLEIESSQGHIPRNIETVINELEYYYYQSSEYLETKKVA